MSYKSVSDNFQIVPLPAVSNYVHLGEDRTISCKVSSRICKVSNTLWTRYAGRPVEPSDNVKLVTNYIDDNTVFMEMVITNVTIENTGAFQCEASNECGEPMVFTYIHLTGSYIYFILIK